MREARKATPGRAAPAPGRGRRLHLGLLGGDAVKLAMVFPGQGSQAVGMLRGYEGLPEVEKVRSEAAQALGADFIQLLDDGPAEKLNQTVNTQPAMGTAGYAAYRARRAPRAAQRAGGAGHTLRQYTALVAPGAIEFRDCLPLVRFRAQSMQEAVPEGRGAMAAILMLDDDQVRAACAAAAGGGRARHRSMQGEGRQARNAAAGERAVPLLAHEAGGGKARALSPVRGSRGPENLRHQQRRCRDRSRAGKDQGRARAAGGRARALGRDDPEDARDGRDPRDRVRAGQGARRHDQAHLARGAVVHARRPGIARTGAQMLENRIALVTGASRGIGHAIAEQLAKDGAKVIGTSTSEEGAKKVPGIGMVLDVRDAAQTESLITAIQKQHGDIAILVNNAGITRDNLALRMKDAEFDEVIDINLRAVFRLSRAVMRGMMKARWGRIISVTSVVGASGNAGQANYAAAKAAVAGMTRSLARELGSRNITVNCVAPGFIDTDMTRALSDEQKKALQFT